MGRRRSAALHCILLCAGLASGARAATFDYLHIEANEGGSSGGHVAVRFDDEVYHFQHHPGGLLKLRRDDVDAFRVRYALLENRPIHVSRIAVSDETRDLLRDGFVRRLQREAGQYGRLAALTADVGLFELWQRRRLGEGVTVPVRAAGYFAPWTTSPGDGSRTLAELRTRVARRFGAGFLARRRAEVRAELGTMRLRAVRTADAVDLEAYPLYDPTAASRYADALERLSGLDVLAAAPGLYGGAVRVAWSAPPLEARERRTLARFAEQLAGELAVLPASRRSDWGYALLLGMARLAAMDATLAADRFVVLDTYPPDAGAAPIPAGALREPFFAALAAQTRAGAEKQRAELFGQPRFREADYSALEMALNAQLEVDQARAGAPLRLRRERALPERAAARGDLVAPSDAVGDLDRELATARRATAAYGDRLAAAYGYNLITRNCVSEIFDVIGSAIGGSSRTSIEPAVGERLGGVVRTRGTLNFIPFVSAGAVQRRYAVIASERWPSFRERRLAALDGETGWWVRLRESNTLTATAYRPAPTDSTFLFFTDDAWATRPLLGAANLLYAAAGGAVGLATWPADGGRRLSAGAWGALFSLPELLFVNMRKGGTAYLDPADMASGAGP